MHAYHLHICTPMQSVNLRESGSVMSAVGITNQRETTIVWDKITGVPLYNAIGMCDDVCLY